MTHYAVTTAWLWGDYGRILVNGMTQHLPTVGGLLQLERAAPGVPELTFPGFEVVVRESLRRALLESNLTGIVGFRPLLKARIVELDWTQWDRSLKDPPIWPPDYEPEEYILSREHNPKLAQEIGDMWVLDVEPVGTMQREILTRVPRTYRFTWRHDRQSLPDLALAPRSTFLVSNRGREWLEDRNVDWLEFTPVIEVRGDPAGAADTG
ncbi:MAG: hypothetical protein IT379_27505 [Deltaproteobacteria bacterium]|nr:hypothetical protein [Deltaproteobacteria bacterium]